MHVRNFCPDIKTLYNENSKADVPTYKQILYLVSKEGARFIRKKSNPKIQRRRAQYFLIVKDLEYYISHNVMRLLFADGIIEEKDSTIVVVPFSARKQKIDSRKMEELRTLDFPGKYCQ